MQQQPYNERLTNFLELILQNQGKRTTDERIRK